MEEELEPCQWCVRDNVPIQLTPLVPVNKLCPRHNAEAHDGWK